MEPVPADRAARDREVPARPWRSVEEVDRAITNRLDSGMDRSARTAIVETLQDRGRWWRGERMEASMADDKALRAPQDSLRIAMGEDYEVDYWTKKFGISRQKLQQAVNAVGNSVSAVEKHLGQ